MSKPYWLVDKEHEEFINSVAHIPQSTADHVDVSYFDSKIHPNIRYCIMTADDCRWAVTVLFGATRLVRLTGENVPFKKLVAGLERQIKPHFKRPELERVASQLELLQHSGRLF